MKPIDHSETSAPAKYDVPRKDYGGKMADTNYPVQDRAQTSGQPSSVR